MQLNLPNHPSDEERPPAPAPLYEDPVFQGPADPRLFFNPLEHNWWMLYNRTPVAFFVPHLSPHAKLVTLATVVRPVPSRGQRHPAPDCHQAPRSAPVR